MADVWGRNIRLSLFGESHGPAVGMVVDGLPAGLEPDMALVRREMARRAPGQGPLATARSEADEVEILSGLYRGRTTGSALCAVIRNRDTRSGDYGTVLRPGHADWTALEKYGGHADMRGGGHFSGRLTAPLVFAGALAKQLLARHGVAVYGRILAIGPVADESEMPDEAGFAAAAQKAFAVADDAAGERMQSEILDAKADGDSVGGVVQVAAFGAPAGLGQPFFDGVESVAAGLFFAIPAVKGVSFGDGFALAGMRGSAANDPLCLKDGQVAAESNRCGGLLGGITTGGAVVALLGIKPTPSIARGQRTVDAATLEETVLEQGGRHDPCIVPRALPAAEAALALALLECLPQEGVL